MEDMFMKYMAEAERGKCIVEKYYYRHVNNASQNIVMLIFPDNDSRLLSSAFRYLNSFLSEFHYDVVIILSSIDLTEYDLHSNVLKKLYIYDLSQSQMASVLRFYSFIQERINIRLLSFSVPFNQKANDLIGFKDITADNLTYHYLYGMF